MPPAPLRVKNMNICLEYLNSAVGRISARWEAKGRTCFALRGPRSLLQYQELGSLIVSIPRVKKQLELDAA